MSIGSLGNSTNIAPSAPDWEEEGSVEQGRDTSPSAPEGEGSHGSGDAQPSTTNLAYETTRVRLSQSVEVHRIEHSGTLHCLVMAIICAVSDVFLRMVGMTIYTYAASRKDTSLLQYLIQHKKPEDLDKRDGNGDTPLLKSIESRSTEATAFLLLSSKPDLLAANNKGSTPLNVAVNKAHLDLLKIMIDLGGIEPKRDDITGGLMILGAYYGSADIIQALINTGADANVKNEHGDTALGWAAEKGFEKIVALLISAGADVNVKSGSGDIPLMWAARHGRSNVAKKLIAGEGANLNVQSHSGNTALILASAYGHKEVVEALVDAGADVSIRNQKGFTALDLAKRHDHQEIASLLDGAGVEGEE